MEQRRPRSKSLPDRLREPPNKATRKEGRRLDATKASMMTNTRLATALLDDIRTEQVAATAYDKTFYTQRFTKLCGSRLGLDPAETLCVPCMWLLSKPPPPRAFYNHLSVPKRHWKPHHDSLFQLIDCCLGVGRSGSACRLCMMLWQAICLAMQKARRDHGPRVIFAENYMHHVGKAYGLYRPDCFDKLCTIPVADKQQLVLQPNIGLSTEHAPYTYSASCKLEITELEADRKGHSWRVATRMPQSSASSETFAQIDEWIRKCHQDHKQCTEEDVSWDDQPTRLLHLPPGSSRAMLIHGRAPKNQLLSAPPRYVTLSYRWGTATPSAPRLSLTQDNDVQLRRGIDVQALPRTLRDACLAVQRLGYQHIWIDRLCIFQDSPDDWATEAQTMARVYKNASLNIHAGRSAHEDSGIFQDSPIRGGYMPLQLRAGSPLPQQKAQASLPGWCWQSPQERREAVAPLSSHQDILVKLTSQEHYDSLAVKRGHLADRGWVFQERKFSRRKILFSSHLVHWECREAHASETEHMRSLPVLPENEDHILSWHLAVEEYSQTRLTFPGDRIWAIAGFARETIEGLRSTIPKEQYCMGLWKSSLLYDLAWISTKPVDASNQCIAPSWSWVSIGGAVEWPRMLTLQDSHDGRKVSVAELHAEPTKIELTHINPDDIFGPVINGRLRLHGRLRPVAVQDPNMRVLLPHARLRGWQLLEVRESWDRCGLVPRATTTWDDPVLMSAFLLPLYTAPRDFTDLTSTSQQIRVDCLILASSGTIDREGCTLRTARRRSFSTLDEEADWPDTYERLGVVLIANIAGAHVLHADLWSWLREYPARDVVIE